VREGQRQVRLLRLMLWPAFELTMFALFLSALSLSPSTLSGRCSPMSFEAMSRSTSTPIRSVVQVPQQPTPTRQD
jgi:hypothetical protein